MEYKDSCCVSRRGRGRSEDTAYFPDVASYSRVAVSASMGLQGVTKG